MTMARTLRGTSAPAPSRQPRSLLCFAQISDTHIADALSPTLPPPRDMARCGCHSAPNTASGMRDEGMAHGAFLPRRAVGIRPSASPKCSEDYSQGHGIGGEARGTLDGRIEHRR